MSGNLDVETHNRAGSVKVKGDAGSTNSKARNATSLTPATHQKLEPGMAQTLHEKQPSRGWRATTKARSYWLMSALSRIPVLQGRLFFFFSLFPPISPKSRASWRLAMRANACDN